MARRALSQTCLGLVRLAEQAVSSAVAESGVRRCRIGLSGGADSLALAAAMAWARDHRRGPLAGVDMAARVIDHGLQPGSAGVAEAAAAQGRALGLDTEVVRVEVAAGGQGVEAAARSARYAALERPPEALVVLAHTLDDQAETVLLGLARGSGTRSLAGMPARRGLIVRPFLGVRRADTERACLDWGLTWWNDPTNEDEAYARSRLRAGMRELDRLLGPGLAEALARTADLCRQDADHLDALAEATGPEVRSDALPVDALAGLPPAIRHRILLAWLREPGGDAVTRDHVLAVDALITNWHGQAAIQIPGAGIRRQAGVLTRDTPY